MVLLYHELKPFLFALLFLGAMGSFTRSVWRLARLARLGRDRPHMFDDPVDRFGQVIYLAFFLPMAATRVILTKSGLITDPGTVAALVTLSAIIAPLVLHRIVRGTALRILFERPARFRLQPRKTAALQPAE